MQASVKIFFHITKLGKIRSYIALSYMFFPYFSIYKLIQFTPLPKAVLRRRKLI